MNRLFIDRQKERDNARLIKRDRIRNTVSEYSVRANNVPLEEFEFRRQVCEIDWFQEERKNS